MGRLRWLLLALGIAAAAGVAFFLEDPARKPLRPEPLREDWPSAPLRAEGPPNVVLVIGCTLRADQIPGYGGDPAVMPFVASLAERGARLADPITTAPWTKPAVTSLITGFHASRLGAVELSGRRNTKVLPDAVETLAERLSGHGYATWGFVANTNANAQFGMGQGFEYYSEPETLWRDEVKKIEGVDLVDEALDHVSSALTAGEQRPIFLELLLVDAHRPNTTSRRERLVQRGPGIHSSISAYRAMLHRFDVAVARLDEGLRAMGLREDNTVFVLVGDHGEGLRVPEHHGKGHGNFFYESTAKVPWLVSGPSIAPGTVVDGLSSHVDLPPTVLDLIGVGGEMGEGRSLAPALRGERARTERERSWVQTFFAVHERAAVYTDEVVCTEDFAPEATEARRKRNGPGSLGFETGCFERQDGQFGAPVEREGLMDDLREWHAGTLASLEGVGAAPDARVDEAVNRQLEALGYLENGEGEGVPEP